MMFKRRKISEPDRTGKLLQPLGNLNPFRHKTTTTLSAPKFNPFIRSQSPSFSPPTRQIRTDVFSRNFISGIKNLGGVASAAPTAGGSGKPGQQSGQGVPRGPMTQAMVEGKNPLLREQREAWEKAQKEYAKWQADEAYKALPPDKKKEYANYKFTYDATGKPTTAVLYGQYKTRRSDRTTTPFVQTRLTFNKDGQLVRKDVFTIADYDVRPSSETTYWPNGQVKYTQRRSYKSGSNSVRKEVTKEYDQWGNLTYSDKYNKPTETQRRTDEAIKKLQATNDLESLTQYEQSLIFGTTTQKGITTINVPVMAQPSGLTTGTTANKPIFYNNPALPKGNINQRSTQAPTKLAAWEATTTAFKSRKPIFGLGATPPPKKED